MNEIKTNIIRKIIIIDNKKEILRNEKNYYFYDIVLNDIINIILDYKIKDNLTFKKFLKENIKIDNEKKEIKIIKNKMLYYEYFIYIFNKENEFKEMKKFLKNENNNLFKIIQIDNSINFYYDINNKKSIEIYKLKNEIIDNKKLINNELKNLNEIKNNLIKFIFN